MRFVVAGILGFRVPLLLTVFKKICETDGQNGQDGQDEQDEQDGQDGQDGRLNLTLQETSFTILLMFLSGSVYPEMIFVQNLTQPDFQATSLTPKGCVICDIFLVN